MYTALKELRQRRANARRASRFRNLRYETLEIRMMLNGTYAWNPPGMYTDWGDPSNWTALSESARLAAAPTAADNLEFTQLGAHLGVDVPTAGAAHSVLVQNLGTVNLNMKAPINVAGTLTVDDSTLVVNTQQGKGDTSATVTAKKCSSRGRQTTRTPASRSARPLLRSSVPGRCWSPPVTPPTPTTLRRTPLRSVKT